MKIDVYGKKKIHSFYLKSNNIHRFIYFLIFFCSDSMFSSFQYVNCSSVHLAQNEATRRDRQWTYINKKC